MPFQNIFQNKKILITGHTGFKGSWLTAWLKELGAHVTGIALEPQSDPSNFIVSGLDQGIQDLRVDLRNKNLVQQAFLSAKPDFVFHLAAQSLVKLSYNDPVRTYETNVIGTLHVLEALRELKDPCIAVLITSDKCYDNAEWVWGYRETDILGGRDPYSASKGAAELVIRSHVNSFFPKNGDIRIGIGRAGNVIGGGDWSEDRIVPDCVRAWSKGDQVILRNPKAIRPWQHVLEPLCGYLNLALRLKDSLELHGEPFNFGPPANQDHTVKSLVHQMSLHWDQVRWQEMSQNEDVPYESGLLKLNCDKALYHLNWQATWNFERTVKETVEWYRNFYEQSDSIVELTKTQIQQYHHDAKTLGLGWAQ